MINQSPLKNLSRLLSPISFTLLIAAMPVAQADAIDSVVIQLNDDRGSRYEVTLDSIVGATWTYSFTKIASQDQETGASNKDSRGISHQNLALGPCLDHVVSATGPWEILVNGDPSVINIDPEADYPVLKWDQENGGTFSFTLDDEYPKGTDNIIAVIKSSTHFGEGLIDGPICETPQLPDTECPPQTEMVGQFVWDSTTNSYEHVTNSGDFVISGDDTSGSWSSATTSVAQMILIGLGEPAAVDNEVFAPSVNSSDFSNGNLNGQNIATIKLCEPEKLLVEGVEMTGDCNNLAWTTASEENNVKFRAWQMIGEVNSKANNREGASYSKADLNSVQAECVLQAIDVNGKNTFHVRGADGTTYTYELVAK